jgi:hypothetical protein
MRKETYRELLWDNFSNGLRSALLDLFRSPSLADVTIINHNYFPLSIFSALTTHVKQLRLLDVRLKGTSALPPFQLTQLEILMISVRIDEEDAEFFLQRHLLSQTYLFFQLILKATATLC